MADGVVLNSGSGGVTAATDDCGAAGHAQIVKLAISTDASATAIPADATNGLLADVSRVVPGTGASNLGKAEDVAFASGDVGVLGMTVREDTPTSGTSADGDYQTLKTNNVGRLYTTATVDAALPAGTNNIGDVDVLTLPALAAGTNNIGDVDVASIAAGDNNIGNVDIVTMPNVTLAAGTNTNEVVGDAADDAVASGNPVLVGGVAVETDGTDPTTVSAEGDVGYLRTDRARRLLVSEHHPRSFFTSADYASAQTNASVQGAPGAGLSLYITDIVISNGATAGNITLLDGSGGTVKFEIYPAINGGVALSLRQPIRLTANTALCLTSTTVTTHSVNIGGYIAP